MKKQLLFGLCLCLAFAQANAADGTVAPETVGTTTPNITALLTNGDLTSSDIQPDQQVSDGILTFYTNPKDDYIMDKGNIHIPGLYQCYNSPGDDPNDNPAISDDGWIYSHSMRWMDGDRINSKQGHLSGNATINTAAVEWYQDRRMGYITPYDEITRNCHLILELPQDQQESGYVYRIIIKGHFVDCHSQYQDCHMDCDHLMIFYNDKTGPITGQWLQIRPFYLICTGDGENNDETQTPTKQTHDFIAASRVLLSFVRNGDGTRTSGFTIAYFAVRTKKVEEKCDLTKEFPCDDGKQCVPIHFKCDNIYHCDDLSDEKVYCSPMQQLVAALFMYGSVKTLGSIGAMLFGLVVIVIIIAVISVKAVKHRNQVKPSDDDEYEYRNDSPSPSNRPQTATYFKKNKVGVEPEEV